MMTKKLSGSIYSPEMTLGITMGGRISNRTFNTVKNPFPGGKASLPYFSSRRTRDYKYAELQSEFPYEEQKQGESTFIKLKSIESAIKARRQVLGERATMRCVLSADKGDGYFIVTIFFPDRKTAQSFSNHLVICSWLGKDNYSTIKARISTIYDEVRAIIPQTFIGGDFCFICTIMGISCSQTNACPCCKINFKKGCQAEKNILDKSSQELRDAGEIVGKAAKTPIWIVDPRQIVPPVLHIKLLIGNAVGELMKEDREAASKLRQFLNVQHLEYNRRPTVFPLYRKQIHKLCGKIDELKCRSSYFIYLFLRLFQFGILVQVN